MLTVTDTAEFSEQKLGLAKLTLTPEGEGRLTPGSGKCSFASLFASHAPLLLFPGVNGKPSKTMPNIFCHSTRDSHTYMRLMHRDPDLCWFCLRLADSSVGQEWHTCSRNWTFIHLFPGQYYGIRSLKSLGKRKNQSWVTQRETAVVTKHRVAKCDVQEATSGALNVFATWYFQHTWDGCVP